jgi:hypothetical protein
MNEETVKNTIILPYFQSLGFDKTQLEFETSFTIRLGTFAHLIDGVKDRATGRLDILFKKNGENLFVVETKAEGHKISDDDKLQAISYARLLQNIAPFAIVSNGIETKVYDVITGIELPTGDLAGSTYVKNGYKIAIDQNIRYDALKSFIGLNFDNLKIFCGKQLTANMQNLIASEHNSDAKFNPEIYLRRRGIKKLFDDFLSSDKKIFGIVAESGFGKTNAICDLAIEYNQTNPTLFFSASQITDDFSQEIAYELSWDFDGDRTGVSVIKRIAEILIQYNRDLVIFLDAIDEFPNNDSKLLLERFIKNCPKGIKICLTCKKSLWPGFTSSSDIHSFIYNSLFMPQKDESSSFVIGPFSDAELDEALLKYQKFFQLPEIKGYTKELCRNPLMLRSLSEVYRSQINIPDNLIAVSVTKTFLDKKFEKNSTPDKDLKCLSSLGHVLLDQDKDAFYEDELPHHIVISDFLISFNLLRKTRDDKGRSIISFQYDYIRNYIIAFHSLKLDILSDSEITAIANNNMDKSVARNLFSYYAQVSDKKTKRLIQKEFSAYNLKRAEIFVDSYQQIIDTEFKAFRNRFYPFTNENIGLLVFFEINSLIRPEYGFRAIKEGELKVVWLEYENGAGNEFEKEKTKIAQSYSVDSTFLSSDDFTVVNPSEYARDIIINQLKQMVEQRFLDESKNDNIMIEYIIEKSKQYETFFKLTTSSGGAFPIDLENLFQKVTNNLRSMSAFCERSGAVSYQLPVDMVKLYQYLKLIKANRVTINADLLPLPNRGTVPVIGAEIQKYTDEEMIKYLTTLFSIVLQEYQVLVETNFQKQIESMSTYELLPARVIGELDKKDNTFHGLTYCIIKGDKETAVEIKLKESKSIFDSQSMSVQALEGTIKLRSYHSSVIWLFFEPDYSRLSDRTNNIIQNRVYDLVYSDLKKIYHW